MLCFVCIASREMALARVRTYIENLFLLFSISLYPYTIKPNEYTFPAFFFFTFAPHTHKWAILYSELTGLME